MSSYFTEQLNHISKEHDRSNPEWVRFIKDHVRVIIANSPIKELHIDKLNLYKHRPKSLFKEFDINSNDAWIILMVNNIPSSGGIPPYITEVYVPSQGYINTLKDMFSKHTRNIK